MDDALTFARYGEVGELRVHLAQYDEINKVDANQNTPLHMGE